MKPHSVARVLSAAIIAVLMFGGSLAAVAQQLSGTAFGPIAAPVSVIIYADLECPFSAATLPELEKVAKLHAADMRFDVRQFPLPQHDHSELAHEAALAAGAQGKYLAMANLIQANQKQMDRVQYLHYATMLQLNKQQFLRDLDSHRFAARVQEDLAEGRALGVDTTPTIFINGQRLSGSMEAPALNGVVERSLAHARGLAVSADTSKPLPAEDTRALALKPTASLGPAEAPVTIVEFTDFQCPFCRGAEAPLHQLLAGSAGKVRLVYRNYPLDFHTHAELAAEAAMAAGDQGQFWPMHDLLFANQTTLDRAHFDLFARQLNLDLARFDHDLDSGRFRAEIAADRELGKRYGVDGTPSFFINGREIVGIRTLPELQQAVQIAMGDANPAATVTVARDAAPNRHFIKDPTPTPASANQVTVDWYIDLEAAASPAIGPVLQDLARRPSVQVAFHSYTLPSHPNSPLAYRALMAASLEGKFWPLYNALAGHSLPTDASAARAAIVAAATSVHLDPAQVTASFDDPKLGADIDDDQQEAYRRGVRGVPVVFIDQHRIDGIQPEATYASYIAEATGRNVAVVSKP